MTAKVAWALTSVGGGGNQRKNLLLVVVRLPVQVCQGASLGGVEWPEGELGASLLCFSIYTQAGELECGGGLMDGWGRIHGCCCMHPLLTCRR